MKTDIHNKDFARRLVLKKKKGELGNGLSRQVYLCWDFGFKLGSLFLQFLRVGLGGHYHLYRPL